MPISPIWNGFAGSAAGALSSMLGGLFGTMQSNIASKLAYVTTRETNATNKQIADERNQMEIELQNQQNAFNLQQWNRNNEYNTPSAILQRMTDAGINPNVAISGITGSPYTSSPVQQTSIPNLTTPQLQSGADALMQGGLAKANILANLGKSMSSSVKDMADAKRAEVGAENENRKTTAEIEKIFSEKGLNEDLARKATAEVQQINQNIQNMRQQIEESKAKVMMLDEQTRGEMIDNAFRADNWTALLKKVQSETKWTDEQTKYFGLKVKSDIALNYACALNQREQAELHRLEQDLVPSQRELIEAQTTMLGSQNEYQVANNKLFDKYGERQTAASVDAAEWNNTPLARGISVVKDVAIGVGSVCVGISSLKGRVPLSRTTTTDTQSSRHYDSETGNVYHGSHTRTTESYQ